MMNRGIHVRTIDDLLNMKLDTEIGKGKMGKIFFHHFESTLATAALCATARDRRIRFLFEPYSQTTKQIIIN